MILIHQSDMCNVRIWNIQNISSKYNNTDIAVATTPCALQRLDHAASQQSTSVSTIPFCAFCTTTYSLIAPTKCTQFIHYTHLLCLSHVFRCYITVINENSARATKVVSDRDGECDQQGPQKLSLIVTANVNNSETFGRNSVNVCNEQTWCSWLVYLNGVHVCCLCACNCTLCKLRNVAEF
jgi:hypothetical protein